jgi:hypothetical protein
MATVVDLITSRRPQLAKPLKHRKDITTHKEHGKYGNKQNQTFASVAGPVKEASEPKSVSVAPILKRKPLVESSAKRSSDRRRQRNRVPEHPLYIDWKGKPLVVLFGCIVDLHILILSLGPDDRDQYAVALATEADESIQQVQTALMEDVEKVQKHDKAFISQLKRWYGTILSPLAGDDIETEFTTNDGYKVTRTLNIVERVEAFRADLLQREAKLKHYWSEIDKVQREIEGLGIQVLGIEAFKERKMEAPKPSGGYANEVQKWGAYLKKETEELEKEIAMAGKEAVEKLAAAERVTSLRLFPPWIF